MARIRSIKPEFFTSETLKRVSKITRLTFIGLWTYVDDNGVGVDNPRLIAAALYPLEEDFVAELQQVEDDLQSLEWLGVIRRYRVDSRQFLHITNWTEHQAVSHPRKPRYPMPPPMPSGVTPGSGPRPSGKPPANPASDTGAPADTVPNDSGKTPEDFASRSGVAPETLSGADSGATRDESGPNEAPEDQEPAETEEPAGQMPRESPSGNPPEPLWRGSALSREQGTGNREQGPLTSEPAAPDPDTPPERPDVERVCTHLANRIAANGSKRPTVGERWRHAARLMLDRDGPDGRGIPEDDVHAAIDWCQNHPFWRSNVMSMPKLREKYDQLRLQAERERNTPVANGPQPPRPSTADQRVAQAAEIAAHFRAQDGPAPTPVNLTEILQLLPGANREP